MAKGNTGMFNFNSIMEQFYNWKPDKRAEDDVAGQQLKNTFQGDFIQTVLNNQMAKDLAYTNAEVATGQMKTAAQLELANQSQIMKDEFDYGMQKMGAEYDYQSKFATDEANRELNKMGALQGLIFNRTRPSSKAKRTDLNISFKSKADQVLQGQPRVQQQIGAQGKQDQTKQTKVLQQIDAQEAKAAR